MEPIRLTLVGHGVRGKQWAASMGRVPGVQLEAIVDRLPVQGVRLSTFPTLEQALDAGVADAVVVATPPEAHRGAVLACVERRIPVLCEKPLTETLAEAREIAQLATAASTVVWVGMNFRYVPAVQQLRSLVLGRDIGSVMFGQFSYTRNRNGRDPRLNDYPLSMQDPFLLEQAVHHIDLIRYAYCQDVKFVQCKQWNPQGSGYEGNTCLAALLELEDGTCVTYFGSWTAGTNRLWYEWRSDFTGGAVRHCDPFADLRISRLDTGFHVNSWAAEPELAPFAEITGGACEPFRGDLDLLLAAFAAAVRGDEVMGPTAVDHLNTLAVVDACQRASGLGMRVLVESRAEV